MNNVVHVLRGTIPCGPLMRYGIIYLGLERGRFPLCSIAVAITCRSTFFYLASLRDVSNIQRLPHPQVATLASSLPKGPCGSEVKLKLKHNATRLTLLVGPKKVADRCADFVYLANIS